MKAWFDNLDPSMVSAVGTWICAATLLVGFVVLIVLIDRAIDKRFGIGEEENGY